MKILYFHQHFSTPKGSTGTRSYEMARNLVLNGHEVIMICGSYKGGHTGLSKQFTFGKRVGIVDGIKVIEFKLSYSNKHGILKRLYVFLKFVLRSSKIVFTEKYDLVFATSTPLTAGIPGIIARWLRFKPFVFEVRDLWPELPKALGMRNPLLIFCMAMLERMTYFSAHRIIGLSPGIVHGIKQKSSLKPITMISNGCDLTIFKSSVKSWRPHGVKETDFVAIYSGTHGIANGLSALIDVAEDLLKRKRSDIKIILIGDGKQKPDLYAKALEKKLNNLIFLEPLCKHELAGLMASSNIGLQILANIPAFYYGTSPNKFFDYIASGLPVLLNYPGWLANLVNDNQCGFSIKPNDVNAFANCLEQAADNRIQLQKMSVNARNLAEIEFDRNILAKRFLNCLTMQFTAKI